MTSNLVIRILIVFLSVVGLANALYFTFAYYGRIKKARWVPEILCAREGSSCVTVVQTPYARVFGVPNSLLGIFYYVLVIVSALVGGAAVPNSEWGGFELTFAGLPVSGSTPLSSLLLVSGFGALVSSGGTVVLGIYLVYALRRILHIHCPLCYLGHAINLTVFILLMARANW